MMGILLADVVYTVFGITLAVLYGYGLYKDEKEKFDYGKKEGTE